MKDTQKAWILVAVILLLLAAVYFFTIYTSTSIVPQDTSSQDMTQEAPIVIDEPEEDTGLLDLSSVEFIGNGTEPFWGFSASGTTLILREPSDTGPMDLTTYVGVTMTQSGTSVNITGGLNLDLTLSPCSDGMSDIVYAYSSIFVAGPKTYTGCANTN